MSKCIYCKTAMPEGSVFDVCRRCGIGVWGENMYNAILQNMQDANSTGDLYQGSVTDEAKKKLAQPTSTTSPQTQQTQSNSAGMSLVSDAMSSLNEQHEEESTLDGMKETQITPSANDLIEEKQFVME